MQLESQPAARDEHGSVLVASDHSAESPCRMAIQKLLLGSIGGEGGIRTHEGREAPPVFKTGAFNRSATSPWGAQFPARARDCPARPPLAWPILMAAARGRQAIGHGSRIVIHLVLHFVT